MCACACVRVLFSLTAGQPAPPGSLLAALQSFTNPEVLEGQNRYNCEKCGLSVAHKQFVVDRPPAVLVLHLKRFEITMRGARKLNTHVHVEEYLDLTPYSLRPARYRLTAIIEHQGGLDAGHYVCYVRLGEQWYYASDSHTRASSLQEATRAQAYLVFYERL